MGQRGWLWAAVTAEEFNLEQMVETHRKAFRQVSTTTHFSIIVTHCTSVALPRNVDLCVLSVGCCCCRVYIVFTCLCWLFVMIYPAVSLMLHPRGSHTVAVFVCCWSCLFSLVVQLSFILSVDYYNAELRRHN